MSKYVFILKGQSMSKLLSLNMGPKEKTISADTSMLDVNPKQTVNSLEN